jgi:hypothetical protein
MDPSLGQSPPPPAARGSLAARLAGAVASHAYMALAMIIVLVIVVIGMYVYYHGLFFLGPYVGKKKMAAKGSVAGASDDPPADPETESLINSINGH